MRYDLHLTNLTNTRYWDHLSRYKAFALDQGRNVALRFSFDL